MNHAARGFTLTFCLALTAAGPTFAQSTSAEAVPAATAGPIAHVYVGTTKGVYLYNAAATGKLTLVTPKPSTIPAGLLIGITGKYMISLGTYLIHSYQLSSTGTVDKQISSIDTRDYYGGGGCGGDYKGQTVGMASLNHQGRNVYVVFPIDTGDCPAFIQTYNIAKSGDLTFNLGVSTGDNAGSGLFQSPTIMANDVYAYAASDFSCCGGLYPQWMGYKLGSNGGMQNWTFNMSGDNPHDDEPVSYFPMYVTSDPTNHLAAIVAQEDPNHIYSYLPGQLASYTVDAQGNTSSTSTPTNMPTSLVGIGCCYFGFQPLNMSPSGKILAVAGDGGVQVFHFNGAAPITTYSLLLTTDPISFIHWDDSNHLYAVSAASKKVYVFTVTPTLIAKVVGSPFSVPTGTPNALVVVPK
jgi:hypothetical protein